MLFQGIKIASSLFIHSSTVVLSSLLKTLLVSTVQGIKLVTYTNEMDMKFIFQCSDKKLLILPLILKI